MKEYLNVGDVLKIPSSTGDDGSVGSVIGCDGNMIAQCCEDISMSMMSNRFRNDLRNERARVISHAINSHDELVAMNKELLEALERLLSDMRLRAKLDGDVDSNGCVVLNCGNGVLYAAKQAIEKAKGV